MYFLVSPQTVCPAETLENTFFRSKVIHQCFDYCCNHNYLYYNLCMNWNY